MVFVWPFFFLDRSRVVVTYTWGRLPESGSKWGPRRRDGGRTRTVVGWSGGDIPFASSVLDVLFVRVSVPFKVSIQNETKHILERCCRSVRLG